MNKLPGNYSTTTKLWGKGLKCPLCFSENCEIFRDEAHTWDSFKCSNCDLYASKQAVMMATKGLPVCKVCRKGMFKRSLPQQKGARVIWFFECRTIGCSLAGKAIGTDKIMADYETGAFIQRDLERKRILEEHEKIRKDGLKKVEKKIEDNWNKDRESK